MTACKEKPLRVVHVSPSDTGGGAEKGSYAVHKALRQAGVDSVMLVQRKYSADASVMASSTTGNIISVALRDRLDRLPLRFYPRRPDNWWTVGWLYLDIVNAIERLNPDVIHFHWTGRGLAPIRILRRLRKHPIVWTLRDMWPLTGGCHYSNGCERFLTGCGTCPQLNSQSAHDLSSWQWRRKYAAWRNTPISFIALSNWMADYARRSPLVFDSDVSVIPTGIDLEMFRPMDRSTVRQIWRLPADRQVVLFGALRSTHDPRKGFTYLRDALRRLGAQQSSNPPIAVVFGAEEGPTDFGIDVRYVGVLQDRISLATLYACADVMVTPSTEENLGKTALESMACGTPVVAFANTGQFDIVSHKVDGYLATDLSTEDLAEGISWCLAEARNGDTLRRNARTKAERRFDIRDAARKHVVLYEQLIAKQQKFAGREAIKGGITSSDLIRGVPP